MLRASFFCLVSVVGVSLSRWQRDLAISTLRGDTFETKAGERIAADRRIQASFVSMWLERSND